MGEWKKQGKLTRRIDNQEYDITWKDKSICYVPPTKKERLDMLKKYVMKECEKCWSTLPREVATLKRQFLRELVDSVN